MSRKTWKTMTATGLRSTWLSVLLTCLAPSTVLACRYTVRDVGFVDLGEPGYHVYLCVRNDTPKELTDTFKQVSYAALLDSNVEFEVVNVDRQKDHPSVQHLEEAEMTSIPVAVLTSPQERVLALPVSLSDKPFKKAAWSCLEGIATSPKREEICKHLVKAYCLVLLIEGKDAAENRQAQQAITEAIDEIAEGMGQMPKPTETPPRLIRIPIKLFSQEKTLLWSLGLDVDDVDGPYVLVVYGRGRWIGPRFEGRTVTKDVLVDLLSLIGGSCECGLDRQQMLGVTLPLRWDQDARSASVRSLGFDPENPLVRVEISQIMSTGAAAMGTRRGADGLGLIGYSEQVVEFSTDPEEATLSPSQLPQGDLAEANVPASQALAPEARSKPASPRPAPPGKPVVDPPPAGSSFKLAWVVIGGLLLAILAGGVFVLVWAYRRVA